MRSMAFIFDPVVTTNRLRATNQKNKKRNRLLSSSFVLPYHVFHLETLYILLEKEECNLDRLLAYNRIQQN